MKITLNLLLKFFHSLACWDILAILALDILYRKGSIEL